VIDEVRMASDQTVSVLHKIRPPKFLLSIVIPCFNEEEVINYTYKRVVDVLGAKDFRLQIIFVDDGSKDRTSDILATIVAADSRAELVTLSRNFGHQAAVSAGLTHSDGDAITIIDADLQDPPEVILGMIDKWMEGYDVVYGIRIKRKEAIWKTFLYKWFYRILRKIAEIDAPLDAGDFSLIDRRILDEINNLPEKNRFFRGLRAWVGFAQVGIEYERAPRAAGVTKYPFLRLLKLAADGIFNFSTVPLTIVLCAGMIMSLLSFTVIVLVIIFRIMNIEIFGAKFGDVQGFASVIIAILLIGGVQLICTGILGEYIGRIYQEVKARPYYIAQNDRVATSTMSGPAGGSGGRTTHQFEAGEAAPSRHVEGPAP
jgi:dolichol-phosphate mannosyltransferase